MADPAPLPAGLSSGPVQIAYAVTDVRAAAASWVAAGAGPFFVREHIPVTNVVVDDQPATFDHSSAFGQWGALMVELICVHEPSSLAPTTGIHHMAWFVDSFADTTDALATAGFAPRLRASAGTTNFALHDGGETFAHLIEIYEPNDGLVGFYDMVRREADAWDGKDPVRTL